MLLRPHRPHQPWQGDILVWDTVASTVVAGRSADALSTAVAETTRAKMWPYHARWHRQGWMLGLSSGLGVVGIVTVPIADGPAYVVKVVLPRRGAVDISNDGVRLFARIVLDDIQRRLTARRATSRPDRRAQQAAAGPR